MKKKNLIVVIAIAVAVLILIGVLIWQLGGKDPAPTDPTETSTSSTEQGSTGETTAPTETTVPEDTEEPTDDTEPATDVGETEPPVTEPVETEPIETEPVETEPVETEPVETEPVETEPAETEPVETEPVETEPPVTFTDVNETVYTTRGVNVRKGPSSDTEKLGSMEAGTAILRVGIGSNGWSKVIYNGEEAYIFTDYLSKEMPVVEEPKETKPAKDKDDKADSAEDKKEDDDVIIYTYPDGTTGTVPMEGATYEMLPGVIVTWHDYSEFELTGEKKENADKGIFYCEYCGRVEGYGANGTCVRWVTGGEHTCPSCGATVPEYTCHTCDEN